MKIEIVGQRTTDGETFVIVRRAQLNELCEAFERASTENKRIKDILKIERNLVDENEMLEETIIALKEALEGWMLDHGDRCRICMERSQSALKLVSNTRKNNG